MITLLLSSMLSMRLSMPRCRVTLWCLLLFHFHYAIDIAAAFLRAMPYWCCCCHWGFSPLSFSSRCRVALRYAAIDTFRHYAAADACWCYYWCFDYFRCFSSDMMMPIYAASFHFHMASRYFRYFHLYFFFSMLSTFSDYFFAVTFFIFAFVFIFCWCWCFFFDISFFHYFRFSLLICWCAASMLIIFAIFFHYLHAFLFDAPFSFIDFSCFAFFVFIFHFIAFLIDYFLSLFCLFFFADYFFFFISSSLFFAADMFSSISPFLSLYAAIFQRFSYAWCFSSTAFLRCFIAAPLFSLMLMTETERRRERERRWEESERHERVRRGKMRESESERAFSSRESKTEWGERDREQPIESYIDKREWEIESILYRENL